ncbi:MAG: ribbon-helix-helix protein, CopG family [Chloroflexota bacterium]
MMVQLTEEQIEALKALAKAKNTSVAKLVRESVAQYVVATDKTAEREEKRRRALEFVEMMKEEPFHDKDGATDVSENHDKYLAEIYGKW